MINYEYSGLFLQDSIDKQLHIYYDNGASHITNTDLYAEEFTLRESICSDSQLRFGGCESSSVEFKIANSGASLKGKSINVQMVLDGHTEAPFTVGTYKVQSDKPTADRFGRVVTAYDAMYDVINADVSDWWKSLSTSFSLKALRNSFFSYFGITQKAVSLPNDNIMVTQKPELDKVSGKGLSTNDYTDADAAIVGGVTAALGDKVDKVTGKGLSTNDYTDADAAVVAGVTTALAGKVDTSAVGAASGVAELDSTGKVPSSQLPSYVDDVLEYDDVASFPATGETGKIYVAKDTNKTYRWGGSDYAEISESLALGETSSTAYAGNKGAANATAIAGIEEKIPATASSSNKMATAADIPDISGLQEALTMQNGYLIV